MTGDKRKDAATSWEDLPEDIRNTYDKLGIPDAEKKRLVSGVAAQYESGIIVGPPGLERDYKVSL